MCGLCCVHVVCVCVWCVMCVCVVFYVRVVCDVFLGWGDVGAYHGMVTSAGVEKPPVTPNLDEMVKVCVCGVCCVVCVMP